jgi:hypothetical protein
MTGNMTKTYEEIYPDLQDCYKDINDTIGISASENYYRDEVIKLCRKIAEEAEE